MARVRRKKGRKFLPCWRRFWWDLDLLRLSTKTPFPIDYTCTTITLIKAKASVSLYNSSNKQTNKRARQLDLFLRWLKLITSRDRNVIGIVGPTCQRAIQVRRLRSGRCKIYSSISACMRPSWHVLSLSLTKSQIQRLLSLLGRCRLFFHIFQTEMIGIYQKTTEWLSPHVPRPRQIITTKQF